jgi:carbon storage regulator
VLVLSRRVGESVVIGDNVTVTVLEVRGDVIRVGVDAPREIAVHRRELLEELAETNRAAASPDDRAVASLASLISRRPAPEPPAHGNQSPDDGNEQENRSDDPSS